MSLFSLQVVMRPCAMVIPDTKILMETELYCAGFKNHSQIAAKLDILFKLLASQVNSSQCKADKKICMGSTRNYC